MQRLESLIDQKTVLDAKYVIKYVSTKKKVEKEDYVQGTIYREEYKNGP